MSAAKEGIPRAMVADEVLAEFAHRVAVSGKRRVQLSREARSCRVGRQLARERAYDAATDRLLELLRQQKEGDL